ncbi:hypothetical protein BX661DRAFT_202603 [Kickxella alabastrina]|uniref:uncharacterized protein n=1 Tax=Kickxella alabastrina TaxID=61397 RepID=UPI002220BD2C|nr:uncharacterized protein BX661DRAFT_202603 [Kickxella alabastrina]KAI7834854.1 hypothetical protein BX661DRAFT_202603 [Kickxella alabastrina]KAJ1946452.1 hypothetical protein GGF37_001154 [Kickxella alabastrina]
MEGGKQFLPHVGCSENTRQTNTAAGATHNTYLHLRLEPSLSSSLMDIFDIFVYPVILSPSIPSTPPPTYEPPPPSYPSPHSLSTTSISTLDLDRVTEFLSGLNNVDSISIAASDMYIEEEYSYDSGFGGSGSSISGHSNASRLQSQLSLSLLVYELLVHQSTLSRSSSRESLMTLSPDIFD